MEYEEEPMWRSGRSKIRLKAASVRASGARRKRPEENIQSLLQAIGSSCESLS